MEILDHISAIDVGQACIVGQGLCLGIETIQGSDELIKFASLKKDDYLNNKAGGKGVFLKSQKINQDTRIDVPTIGINTIQNIANAGFSGIALKANNVQIIDKEICIELANQLGIFIVSVSNKQS
ncbi:LpxI family protein [Amylibacter sp.]|nr:LpxI family protein [Amylibacter sp.]